VVIAGENEIASNSLTVKNMKTGEQALVQIDQFAQYIQKIA
jgi:histidyl-tRNA synthetase